MKARSLTLLLLSALPSLAVRTETVTHDSYADFNRGEPKGVAITDKGLLQLAPQWKQLFDTGQPIVWAVARDAKGNLYAGGGNEGQVFQVTPTGVGTQFFKADEIEVHALAVDKRGNVFVGTSPDGKVYKVTSDGKTNTFFEPKQKYIWALALDKEENLFVATGNKGILYKVSPDGKGDVYYDSDETNLGGLHFDKNGLLLVGSDPSGYVYRLTPPDKNKGETNATAYVVFDAKEKEIKSIAAAPDGTIYAAAIAESGKEGAVYRINTDNYAEPIWSSKDAAPFSLLLRDDGNVFVGTGEKGMLLSLTPRGETTTLFKSDAAQITVLIPGGDGKVIAGTSNLGTLLEVSPKMAGEGVYDSEVIDAKIFAEWGRVEVVAQTPKNTQIELLTRSGNAVKPEKTWTEWKPVGADGTVSSPSARFLQYRVRMVSKDGSTSPSVERARLFFSQRNVAPKITVVELLEPGIGLSRMSPPPPPQQTSLSTLLGGSGDKKDAPPPMAGQVRVEEKPGLRTAAWKAEDPNKDELTFSVSYRAEDESNYRLLKDKMEETFYSWDSTSWPDGMYLLRIEANDANANPPGKGLLTTEDTRAFLVDNTPPKIEVGKATITQRKATVAFKAADATSRIKEARYSVDGRDWQPIIPSDGVFDTKDESFQIVTPELPAGDHSILIHIADELGNPAAASAVVTAK
jgi:sugar lactone lactonase YvrE